MSKLYYVAPPDDQFREVKKKAIEIWKTYSDRGGYSSGRIDKIKDMKNISDNFMFMVAMFDINNQKKLAIKLSKETKEAVSDRIRSGGTPDVYNMFLVF